MKKFNSYAKINQIKHTQLGDSIAYKPQFALRGIIWISKMIRANAVTNIALTGGCVDNVCPAYNFCPFLWPEKNKKRNVSTFVTTLYYINSYLCTYEK